MITSSPDLAPSTASSFVRSVARRQGGRRHRLQPFAFLCVLCLLLIAGCTSGPDATKATCDDYARAGFKEQGDMQRNLLKIHGLDPDSVDNAAGLTNALEDACGGELSNHNNGKASKNGSLRLDDLIPWKSRRW